jgi:hypothetical protein
LPRTPTTDCGFPNLTNWGFDNRASSWVNRTSHNVRVVDRNGWTLWIEPQNSLVGWVGADHNLRALAFTAEC